MLSQNDFNRIKETLPFLEQADQGLIRSFMGEAFLAKLPANKDVYLQGDMVDNIALLLSGSVRVFKIGETGREITLYRFGLGESCVLTANAILNQRTFPAIATVEEDAEVVLIPAEVFESWVKKYDLWRNFVFELLSDRLSTIIEVLDEVVFNRMDQRIASWLIKNVDDQLDINVTHQQIADDLGSSREVISRLLEDFSRKGWIIPSRGSIEVINFEALENMAGM
jgi:CRP/FNR family transcriptional regulator